MASATMRTVQATAGLTMPGIMDNLVAVVIGGALVIVSNVIAEFLKRHGEIRLDKEKRADDRRLGRDQFQRETLLALQEAAMTVSRTTAQKHLSDKRAWRETGEWGKSPVGEELAEMDREAARVLNLLRSRVQNDEVRRMAAEIAAASFAVTAAQDQESSKAGMFGVAAKTGELVDLAGELIRQSFVREEQIA